MSGHTDRPIVIVGCARSGTTLLQAMVHSHPRLSMPPENRFVMPVYQERVEFGDLRDVRNRDAIADFVFLKRHKIRDLGLDLDVVRRRIHEVPPTVGSVLGAVLEQYAVRFGKQRWGDKRPYYIQHLDVILELFPDVQIVHIVRDGRDCVASLKRMPWWAAGYPASVYKWAHAIDMGLQARKMLRPDQYHEVRYEDLVAEPVDQLRALCAFLEEDFDEAMLEHHRSAEEKVPLYKDWHTQVHKPVNQAAVQRWQRDLDPDEVRLFELVAGDQLEAMGYERSLKGMRRAPSLRLRRAYRSFSASRREREAVQAQQTAEIARRYNHPVAAMLTSEQRRLARERGHGDLLGDAIGHDERRVGAP